MIHKLISAAVAATGLVGGLVAVAPQAGAATSTCTAQPTVTVLSATTGPKSGNTQVTITGTNFVSGATVQFGGVSATAATFNSSTQITATSPAVSSIGSVGVTVTDPAGTGTSNCTSASSLADQFTYDAATTTNPVATPDPTPSVTTATPDPTPSVTTATPDPTPSVTTAAPDPTPSVTTAAPDPTPSATTAAPGPTPSWIHHQCQGRGHKGHKGHKREHEHHQHHQHKKFRKWHDASSSQDGFSSLLHSLGL